MYSNGASSSSSSTSSWSSSADPFNWALSSAWTREHCSFAEHLRAHLSRPGRPGQDLTLGCSHVFRWVQDQRLRSHRSVETAVLFVNGQVQLPARCSRPNITFIVVGEKEPLSWRLIRRGRGGRRYDPHPPLMYVRTYVEKEPLGWNDLV